MKMFRFYFLILSFFLSVSFFGCENELSQIKVDWSAKWKMVSTGYNHTCAIDENDLLFCWGNNTVGQFGDGTTDDSCRPKLVNDKKWKSISAGENLTCGITTDNDLYCWGANYYGGTGTGSEEDYLIKPGKVSNMKWKTVTMVKFYLETVCGITTDDELYCWGQNQSVKFGDISGNFSRIPQKAGDYKWKKVDIGSLGGCGISLDDELFCWGERQYSVVDPESETVDIPNKIGNEKWLDVSIFNYTHSLQTCAVRSDSTLFCWGGSLLFYGRDEMLEFGKDWKTVTTGENDICGIKSDGYAHCFGYSTNGKFWNGGSDYSKEAVKIDSNKWKNLSSGNGYKCGIKDNNTLHCWGLNDFGQIGNGEIGNKNAPSQIDDNKWDDISAGWRYTCGIKDKKLYCWGWNYAGQLGDGTEIRRQNPVKISGEDWGKVSTFSGGTCAINENNKLYCWGTRKNYYSLLEESEPENSFELEKVDDDEWKQVTKGQWYTCGIKTDNHIYCWGYNNYGQLGYENTDETDTPHKLDDNEWKSVHAGNNTTCGLNNDDLLFCWGNYLSECSENSQDGSIRQISEIKWKVFDMNSETLCGINEDDDLYCWGFTGSGELGIGEFDDTYACEPTKVGEKKWKDISTGHQGTCGIDSSGDLYCWGYNNYGLLGIDSGDKYYADTPQKVGNKKWLKVSLGSDQVCALDENEKLFCWGQNNYGQLGNGLAWVEDMYHVGK